MNLGLGTNEREIWISFLRFATRGVEDVGGISEYRIGLCVCACRVVLPARMHLE